MVSIVYKYYQTNFHLTFNVTTNLILKLDKQTI